MRDIKVFFIIFIITAISIWSEENYINIREIIKNHYIELMVKGKDSQEFNIRRLIKFLEGKIIKEQLTSVDEIQYFDNKNCKKLFDGKWIFQKVDYDYNVISPSPKLPFDYYFYDSSVENLEICKVMSIKKSIFEFNTESIESYGNTVRINEINPQELFKLDIEYFIIYNGKYEEKITEKKNNIKNIFIKILFLQDKAHLSNYQRKIKIYGILEAIE